MSNSSNTETSRPATPNPKEEKGEKGIVGLRNLGNTCYANAALQAIRNITEMTYLCLSENSGMKKTEDSHSGMMVTSYTDLIKTMWGAHRPAYISPDAFWKDTMTAAEKSGYEHFLGRQQQDSHEFLMFVLDQLLEGSKTKVNFVIQRPPPQTEDDKRVIAALTSWKQNFERQYTPLIDLWFGLLEYTTECQGCKNKTYQYETFNSLKVQMPSNMNEDGSAPTLHQMLEADWKEDTIESYACDKCSPTRSTALRRVGIWRMPRCLCVVFKRFLPDGRKIHTPWRLEDDSIRFSHFWSNASPEKSKDFVYEIQSIVDHHGSARGGHYTAQAKSPLNGKWYFYDDESTQDIEKKAIGSSNYFILLRADEVEF